MKTWQIINDLLKNSVKPIGVFVGLKNPATLINLLKNDGDMFIFAYDSDMSNFELNSLNLTTVKLNCVLMRENFVKSFSDRSVDFIFMEKYEDGWWDKLRLGGWLVGQGPHDITEIITSDGGLWMKQRR